MQTAPNIARRTRTLAATSFLLVGLAIGNWPTNARAQTVLPSDGTKRLTVGTHSIKGLYSGNANYSAGVAGPITQTVR